MAEFKKEYLPKSFENQISKESNDTYELGISWAKESVDKIRTQLQK